MAKERYYHIRKNNEFACSIEKLVFEINKSLNYRIRIFQIKFLFQCNFFFPFLFFDNEWLSHYIYSAFFIHLDGESGIDDNDLLVISRVAKGRCTMSLFADRLSMNVILIRSKFFKISFKAILSNRFIFYTFRLFKSIEFPKKIHRRKFPQFIYYYIFHIFICLKWKLSLKQFLIYIF